MPAAHAAIAWRARPGRVDNGCLSSSDAGWHQGGARTEGLSAGGTERGLKRRRESVSFPREGSESLLLPDVGRPGPRPRPCHPSVRRHSRGLPPTEGLGVPGLGAVLGRHPAPPRWQMDLGCPPAAQYHPSHASWSLLMGSLQSYS